jgi:hypothetical protein
MLSIFDTSSGEEVTLEAIGNGQFPQQLWELRDDKGNIAFVDTFTLGYYAQEILDGSFDFNIPF